MDPLFRGGLAYAEAHASPVYVLSALHGLVEPDRVIAPYDLRLPAGEAARPWAAAVVAQLRQRHGLAVDLLVLAGTDLARSLLTALRAAGWTGTAAQPLAGMPVAGRLAWLAARTGTRDDGSGVHTPVAPAPDEGHRRGRTPKVT